MGLHVLHFLHNLVAERGGPSRSVPALCRAQQEQGAVVELLARYAPGSLAPELDAARSAGTCVRALRLWPLLGTAASAVRRADVVHIHGIWNPSVHAFSSLAHALDTPVVFSPRGMLEGNALASKASKKRLALHAFVMPDLQRAALLHATGEPEAQQLQRLGLRPKTVIIPNGVDGPPDMGTPKATEGEGPHGYVLYLGRLHPHKNLPLLLDACHALRAELIRQRLRVRLVGPDSPPHAEQLRAQIRALYLSELVTVEGPVDGDDKWRLIGGAAWVVLPSRSENFGMSVAEALAAGRPALTTTTTPWQVLGQQDCGVQVPPTGAGIEAGMRTMLQRTAENRAQMGARGRAFMAAHYSWPPIARRFLAAYETLR